MVAELFAGLSAFKTMFDLAKGLKDINEAATRNAVAVELQEKILAAQIHQSTLIEQVSSLEAEVAHLKDWEAEKQKYQLTELRAGGGIFAYSKQPSHCLPNFFAPTRLRPSGRKRM
jgi:hypothetical protein